MKKLATLLVIAAVAFTYSCGPSAEEQAKQQAIKDSLYNDSVQKAQEKEKHIQDSIMQKKIADSIEARKQDSIANPKKYAPAKPAKKGKK